MVYQEALVDPNGITLRADCIVNLVIDHLSRIKLRDNNPQRIYDAETSKFALSINLLATSKQVHDEAFLFFYHQPFAFVNSEAVSVFLANMRPATIGLMKDITILQMRCRGFNNNALLLNLRHATGLTTLRFADRITVSDVHLRQKENGIGFAIASKFYRDAAYFIRSFVAVRGVDDLLRVVKFNEHDLRGDDKTRLQYILNDDRKDAIMNGVKVKLMKNLRIRNGVPKS